MNEATSDRAAQQRLVAYAAALEMEVDRLRKEAGFLHLELGAGLARVIRLCGAGAAGGEVEAGAREMVGMLTALRESPGYHPAHDQVIAAALRPLVENSFRRQQALGGPGGRAVALRLELGTEHVEWFPGRLRHILDNLLSNALRYRDPVKAEPWVAVALRTTGGGYELHVSDNGLGAPAGSGEQAAALLSRAAPVREAGLGVGLPVVRLLVEQSGGALEVRSEAGRGTDVTVTLPRYDLDDFLT